MSLRARLLAASLALVVCGLVVADVATYSALRRFMYDRIDAQLASARDSVVRTLLVRDGRFVRAQLEQISSIVPGVYVQVRDAGDNVLIATSGPQVGESPVLPGRLVSSLPAGPGRGDVRTVPSSTGDGDYRVLVTPLGQGAIAVALPLDDTAATLRRLVGIEVLVTVFVVGAAAAVGLWLVRLGLRPLADIERTADAISGGDLSHRVPVSPTDGSSATEVGRLRRAFNVMLDRIDVAFAEQRRSEAAARAAEQQVRRFVADASHELRTPLAAVRAYAELYRRGAADRPADLARVMRSIEDEAARMGVLVDDLLLLTRLDEGRRLERLAVDLGAVAADAVAAAGAVEPTRPISLTIEGSVEVVGDRDRLRQVVDNLLANVRAHTPPGTPAEVAVRVDDVTGEAVVDVADRGPGVPHEAADHVFERFYRADPSRTRDGAGGAGGAGLGLSIVRAITEAHGGSASVSDRPGGGAVFSVRLPLLTDGEAPAG